MGLSRSKHVRWIDEFRVMRHLLANCDRDYTKDIVYGFEEKKDYEHDGIIGLIGHDDALMSLKVKAIWEVINKLEVDGYISGPHYADNIHDRTWIEIKFTDKGRYYFENFWRGFRKALILNILLPIALSIITAILTVLVIGK